jgi:hypothetical protein
MRAESSCTLPGEASCVRAQEESAETIVVKTSAERQTERRVKEPRESSQPTILGAKSVKRFETWWAWQLRPVPARVVLEQENGFSSEPAAMKGEFSAGRKEVAEDAQ